MAFGILYGLRLSGIYKITNNRNNKFYVGSSVQIESRIFKHLALLRKGKHNNGHMQAAFIIDGEESFDFALIEACDKLALIDREQHYIDLLCPHYNICKVAGNTLGVLHTPESKAKMTAANMGNTRMLGKKHTEETKQILRDKASKRTHTEATKEKIAKAGLGQSRGLGRTCTKEHVDKVAAASLSMWNGDDKQARREAAADRIRARWADPVWKACQAEKIRVGKANRLATQGNHYGNEAHKSKLANSERQ